MADYTLWHGDCLEEMDRIEAGSVDAIFSDPPYPYIKREYGYWTEAEWLPMMQEVVRQSRRILKPTGSAVFILQPNSEKVGKMRLWLWKFMVWAGEEWGIVQDAYWWNPATLPTVHTHRDTGLMRPSVKMCLWLGLSNCFRNQDAILWEETQHNVARRAVARSELRYAPSGVHNRDDRLTQAALDRGGVTPYNILPIPNTDSQSSAGFHGHGAGTPLKLADWWLRYISKPGDTVLDMFAGTSTTGVAALPLGRNYIGIERLEKYYLIAHQRLAPIAAELRGELNHLPMFADS